MAVVKYPYETFTALSGLPLQSGKIYIGGAGLDPVSNTKTVYWDNAGEIPAEQPLTITGGVIYRSGAAANVYVTGDYSLRITDSNDVLLWQSLNNYYPDKSVAIGTTKERSAEERDADYINVADFEGFSVDGITDCAPAFQAAFDLAKSYGGGVIKCHADKGTVKIATPVYPCSKTTLILVGDFDFAAESGVVFDCQGTIGEEINTSVNLTVGATTIPMTAAHNMSAGDIGLILGQRNCLSSDASEDTRLGYADPAFSRAYFGEYFEVSAINSNTEIEILNPLIFPDYNINNSSETLVNVPRTRTTIQRLTPIRDIVFDLTGARITKTALHNTGIETLNAYNVAIYNGYHDKGIFQGAFVYFKDSFRCRVVNSTEYMSPAADATVTGTYFKFNSFKCANSDYCDFINITGHNTTQTVDYTYFDDKKCTIVGTASGRVRNARSSITTHPGCYGGSFPDWDITTLTKGIAIRSRATTLGDIRIENLRSTAAWASGSSYYGVSIYQRWARECRISSLYTRNCKYGLFITDASGGDDEKFTRVNLAIGMLTGVDNDYDLYFNRSGDFKTNTHARVLIGQLQSFRAKEGVIYAENYFSGISVNSAFVSDFAGENKNLFAYAGENKNWSIRNVTLASAGATSTVYNFPAITDTTTFGGAEATNVLDEPRVIGDIGDIYTGGADTVSPFYFASTGSAATALSSAADGFVLNNISNLNSTNAFLPGLFWKSSDPSLTTPGQRVAGIVAKAQQTHDGTSAGTRLDLCATALGAGEVIEVCGFAGHNNATDNLPVLAVEGALMLRDGVTAPTADNSSFAQLYIDVADGDLKIRFVDGVVKTITTDV